MACNRLAQGSGWRGVAQGGALVRFAVDPRIGVETEELTSQILHIFNTAGPGTGWLAPRRDERGQLELRKVLCEGDDAAAAWAEVAKAAEPVMIAHLGALFCGGCDCFDALAGKVLM